MKPYTQRTNEEYIQAIEQAKGVISQVAKILGVTNQSVYEKLKNNPDLQDALFLSREKCKDVAEIKLYELIEEGDFQAIKFFLSTKARDRGYGDKIEIDASATIAPQLDYSKLSVEELLQLEKIMGKTLVEPPNIIEGQFID